MLLDQTPPSIDLFTALKQPFDDDVISRTPLSFHHAMWSIHDYLMVSTHVQYEIKWLTVIHQQHDTKYRQGKYSVLAGLSGYRENEPLVDYEALYQPWLSGMLIKFPPVAIH